MVNLLIINIFSWIYRSTRSIANFIAFLSLSLFRLIILVIAIWVSFLLIILSNDVELHPGDFILNRYFNFCNWNLNSLAKDDFSRLNLLQAHNSTYNYDIISICETSLNDTIELKNNLLDGFKHHFSHHPSGNKHGGVGIFYKDTLPLIIRDDLAFNECIVSELRFGKKKIFHTVMYRSPSDKADSIEFENFVKNFENLHTKLLNENPFAMFFTGDFNAHCLNWWSDGDSNHEGTAIDNAFSTLGLSQIIHEPTNFETNKNPSCIDLVFCDQPNLVMESGVRPSLDSFCKHQIIYCKLDLKIPMAPSFHRKLWHYKRANEVLIKRSVCDFNWQNHLLSNHDTNWQINFFNSTILNIMSNFIPNEYIKINPKDPPWITNGLKRLIKKQNRQYKNFKRKGCKPEDKLAVETFRLECFDAIQSAKEKYLNQLGSKLNNPNDGPKSYWKVLNKLMNKCKTPKIPPILNNNKLIIDCKEKATAFNEYFLNQCIPNVNDSVLPPFSYLTEKRLETISFSTEEIINIIQSLNPNKSQGPDNISIRMLQLCGNAIATPLKIIFENILLTGIYPTSWKRANVTPIHKKSDKQLLTNYRPISLLSVSSKIFEKILFNKIYNHLTSDNLITSSQSGFRPGDSTTNQLLYLVHLIHSSFDHSKSREVRHVFLDISKAFDKVWHEGLVFKLKQNGISGSLLTLLSNYLHQRNQRVIINGQKSHWGTIKSGVPQGSVLGPLLFLIYINDLEKGIKSSVKFFADDTSLFSIVTDPILSATELNHDLRLIEDWAFQWKMSFNPDPSKQAIEMLFSQKKEKNSPSPSLF